MEPAHNAELAMLLDFYGPLLTEKQGEMMRLRVEEDLSCLLYTSDAADD